MIKILKDWINGFRTIDYIVPLQNEYKLTKEIEDNLRSVGETISEQFKDLPVMEISFEIVGFKASIIPNNNKMLTDLRRKRKPINFLKVSHENIRQCGSKETRVVNTVYCLGIDNKIWKFVIETVSTYYCRCNTFDNMIMDLCIDYTNEFLKLINLNKMVTTDIILRKQMNYDCSSTKHFDGYLKTFSDEEEYQNYGMSFILD